VTCTFYNGGGFADLSLGVEGDGKGTVTSSPDGIGCGNDCSETYTIGTLVDIMPAPDRNSVFGGWSGDEDCLDGQVSLATDLNCTAVFLTTGLDVDGNAVADALTDGIVLLRFLFGFQGDSLIDGDVVSPDCTRCTAQDLDEFIQGLKVDVDGNGTADALTDGILILRFLFQLGRR